MPKTIAEVISEVLTEIAETDITDNDKKIVNTIQTLVRELRGEGVTGKDFRMYNADELSRIAGTLAILKVSLAEILSRASRNQDVSESILKLKKANFREPVKKTIEDAGIKITVGELDAGIDKRTFKDRMTFIFKKEYHERNLNLWRSVNSLLDVMMKRVDVLLSQYSDVGQLDNSLDFILEGLEDAEKGE